MPWFNVDDGFAFHHKAVRAGNAAIGLWTRAGSWSSQQLTDGFIPSEMVDVLGTPAQARKLVAAGLWHAVDGGFQFHDWTENGRNSTRKTVIEKRQRESDRKARWREQKAEKSANRQVNGYGHGGTSASVPPSVPPSVRSNHSTPLHIKDKDTPSGVSLTRTPARTTARDLAKTAHSPEAHRLVEQYAQTCNQRPPSLVLSELAVEVDKLLAEDWPPERITPALAVLGEKGLGARYLPRIAHEVTNRAPNGHTTPQVSQTDVNIAAFLRGNTQTPSLRALPGGNA